MTVHGPAVGICALLWVSVAPRPSRLGLTLPRHGQTWRDGLSPKMLLDEPLTKTQGTLLRSQGTVGDPIRGIAAISGRFPDSQRTEESQADGGGRFWRGTTTAHGSQWKLRRIFMAFNLPASEQPTRDDQP